MYNFQTSEAVDQLFQSLHAYDISVMMMVQNLYGPSIHPMYITIKQEEKINEFSLSHIFKLRK